ncbi:ATP-dependent RNA helicase A-like [Symsagittifera roscoffensis]
MTFPSPFFVFGEKLRTRAVTAHQMTMVSALQLLLFGSRSVSSERRIDPQDGTEKQMVRLDDWINLDLDHKSAASVVALRPIIEDFIMRFTSEPERALQMADSDVTLKHVIRSLSTADSVLLERGGASGGGAIKRPMMQSPLGGGYGQYGPSPPKATMMESSYNSGGANQSYGGYGEPSRGQHLCSTGV